MAIYNASVSTTLAYYAAQSGLVSLPTLKRQFKHITREMVIYYSNGSGLGEMFSGDGHFSKLLDATRPDAGALAYICDILLSTEPLSGGHGSIVEKSGGRKKLRKTILRNRETVLRQFRNGEIAYSKTALGSCTSPDPCNKKLTRDITACLSCEKSVIKSSRLERVINSQRLFIKELQSTSPQSVELRSEKAELRVLMKYRRKLAAKQPSV